MLKMQTFARSEGLEDWTGKRCAGQKNRKTCFGGAKTEGKGEVGKRIGGRGAGFLAWPYRMSTVAPSRRSPRHVPPRGCSKLSRRRSGVHLSAIVGPGGGTAPAPLGLRATRSDLLSHHT